MVGIISTVSFARVIDRWTDEYGENEISSTSTRGLYLFSPAIYTGQPVNIGVEVIVNPDKKTYYVLDFDDISAWENPGMIWKANRETYGTNASPWYTLQDDFTFQLGGIIWKANIESRRIYKAIMSDYKKHSNDEYQTYFKAPR